MSFASDLHFSKQHNDLWDSAYKKAYPELAGITRIESDGHGQRSGVDTVLTMNNGTVVKVDEKVSRKDYDTVFLEYEAHNKPGWLTKGLACDVIAYMYLPSRLVLLLPYLQLRAAWLQYEKAWKDAYHCQTPTSKGVCVPREVLMAAIAEALRVTA